MIRNTLRAALADEAPLQIAGTINAYSALLAEHSGFKAIYLSGAGVANASYGMPDLGLTNASDVLEDARRITDITSLPLLVDIDTGFGSVLTIGRTIQNMIKAGVAAIHIEDQVQAKRCGHRPGKAIVSTDEMVDRIKACVDARTDPEFVVMARSDALAVEGLEPALARIAHYIEAGADMIFFEGATELAQYQTLSQVCAVPILANMTEFGVTPLYNKEQLKNAGVSMILYPLSAFRAMNYAALQVYETLRNQGTQADCLEKMQTRSELYSILDYYAYENKFDDFLKKGKTDG